MENDNVSQIIDTLKEKACLKQNIYRQTIEIFDLFKVKGKEIASHLGAEMKNVDKDVKISYKDHGSFETRLMFSGDTLTFNMHTNIFNFDESHFIHNSDYLKEDPLRGYCGMIEVYNFLSDSFKYQRLNDTGYLIARIFVNKDRHFFVEGKRQLGFLYNDFSNMVMNEEFVKLIIESSILYSLDFDLWVPAYDAVKEISLLDKLKNEGIQTHKTAKRLGFQFKADNDLS